MQLTNKPRLLNLLHILIFAIFLSCFNTACTRKTVRVDTVSATPTNEQVIQKTTTTETTTESDGCGGFLSCTVDAIGSVIAWPFKAVGALVGGIF